jgi:spore germination protein KC/spore germination protein
MGHRRTILIGEKLAREGISELFDFIDRSSQNRMSTFLVVAQGEASQLLNTKPQFERFPAEAIRELAKSPSVMYLDMKRTAQNLGVTGSDPLVLYMGPKKSQKGEKPVEEVAILGYAQFKNDKMVGVYEGDAMHGVSWLLNRPGTYTTTIDTGQGKQTTLQVYEGQTKITPAQAYGHFRYRVEIRAKARVLEEQQDLNFTRVQSYRELNRILTNDIRKDVKTAIARIQKDQTDSASLGVLILRSFPDRWKKSAKDRWRDLLAESEFVYDIDASVTESGMVNHNVTRGADFP